MSTRHAREPDLTRAGNAGEALRALMLTDGDAVERALVRMFLLKVGAEARALRLREPALRRAALRLAAAIADGRQEGAR